MKDEYKHDSVGVEQVLVSLKQTRIEYEKKIAELSNLALEISMSPAWQDLKVKTEFINTYNAYLTIYNDVCQMMDSFEKYLENKSKIACQIEQKYSR